MSGKLKIDWKSTEKYDTPYDLDLKKEYIEKEKTSK